MTKSFAIDNRKNSTLRISAVDYVETDRWQNQNVVHYRVLVSMRGGKILVWNYDTPGEAETVALELRRMMTEERQVGWG